MTLPDGLTAIGGAPFYKSGITKLLVPSTVTEISQDAFLSGETANWSGGCEVEIILNWVTPCVVMGSYAEQYCLENGVKHVLIMMDPGPESAE